MIHLNELIKQKGIKGRIKSLISVETYYAANIKDFEDNKSNIKVTKKRLPRLKGYYGKAAIIFPSMDFYNLPSSDKAYANEYMNNELSQEEFEAKFRENVIKEAQEKGVPWSETWIEQFGKRRGKLSDKISEIEVIATKEYGLSDEHYSILDIGKGINLHQPTIIYDPSEDSKHLGYFKNMGPKALDTEDSLEKLPSPISILGFTFSSS